MWNHRECSAATSATPGEVVDDAGVRRSRRGDDADDVGAPRVVAQRGAQRVAGQAVVVRRHGERPDAEHVERLADRRVRVLAQGDERTQRVRRRGAGAPPCRGPP